MKYKNSSLPPSRKGVDYSKEELLTKPNESMSLTEIISRFMRGEALPVGQDGEYFEGEEDLEKLKKMDIVDRTEYKDRMTKIVEQYQKEEEERKAQLLKDERDKFIKDVEKRARIKAKKQGQNGPSKV